MNRIWLKNLRRKKPIMNTDASILAHIANLEKEIADLKATVNKPKEKWMPKRGPGFLFEVTIPVTNNVGAYYPTQEDANNAHIDIINYMRMRKFAHERNGNWAPDWQNAKEIKHYVVFNPTYNKWFTQLASAIKTANAVYFKSESDAQELADLLNNGQF